MIRLLRLLRVIRLSMVKAVSVVGIQKDGMTEMKNRVIFCFSVPDSFVGHVKRPIIETQPLSQLAQQRYQVRTRGAPEGGGGVLYLDINLCESAAKRRKCFIFGYYSFV